MLPHFDRGCDVFATQQRRTRCKQTTFASCARRCEQENSSPACIPVILLNGPSGGKTHISTSAPTRRARFTARQNPVPTVANRPEQTGLHQGETVMKLG